MGVSSSRIEDDKALVLCRERKRFVRQALDGRCSLAAAHVAYIQSLRNTGIALRKFVEPEAPLESSLYTSTSATPEPHALTDKSLSQFSYPSPSLSQHIEATEAISPTPSPRYSGRFRINYVKTGGSNATTVEERPPVSVTATLRSSSGTPKSPLPRSTSVPSFEASSSLPGTPPWDYFGLFPSIDNHFSFQDGRTSNQGLDNADDIRQLREEEGIPDLEEDGERTAFIGEEEYVDSEEIFEEPSAETLVQRYERQNNMFESHSTNATSVRSTDQNMEDLNGEKDMLKDDMDEADEKETPDRIPSKPPTPIALPSNEKGGQGKESRPENKLAPKDFLSSIKEIEYIFLKASESGKEVPRMLEANKVHFRPILPERQAQRSWTSMFFTACLVCLEDPEHVPPEPAANSMKYLTWHRSASSRSSSSRNPLGSTAKDSIQDNSDSLLFNSFCMTSGSHASTLDRLYAWERKLYDEVKACGIIRKEYDMKCKLLRQQNSKDESSYKIDRTRAIVKDLHSRIRVAIHRIDSISKKIEELRDMELQPQLMELIEGLTRMWEMMLESHKLQFNIISIAYNSGSSKFSVQSESHRQATVLLQCELNYLCSSFTKWIGAQKSYLQAINGWLLKCVFPLRQKYSRRKNIEFSPRRDLAPPIFVTCSDWLKGLDILPTKEVADSIKGLAATTGHFLPLQEKGHKKNLSSTLPMSWKADSIGETSGNMLGHEPLVDWNSGFECLQSSLVIFFDQLNKFADSSAKMYVELGKSIKEFQACYERVPLQRKQM